MRTQTNFVVDSSHVLDGAASVVLRSRSDESTKTKFPFDYDFLYIVTLTETNLVCSIKVITPFSSTALDPGQVLGWNHRRAGVIGRAGAVRNRWALFHFRPDSSHSRDPLQAPAKTQLGMPKKRACTLPYAGVDILRPNSCTWTGHHRLTGALLLSLVLEWSLTDENRP